MNGRRNFRLTDTSLKPVRSFGILFAVIGIILIPAIVFWKYGAYTNVSIGSTLIGLLMGGLGMLAPRLLHPAFVYWMKFAMVLNWIMTRIIIGLVFLLIMTPIGLIRRLSGSDTPKSFHAFKENKSSYWKLRDPTPPTSESYYRQY